MIRRKNRRDRLKTSVTGFNLGIQNHFSMVSTNAMFPLDYVQEMVKKLKELMSDYQTDNQILVYCGAITLHDVDYREGKPPVDEVRQIDIVADILGNELGMRVTKFTSEEDADERERIKSDFAEGTHLQAVVAIRCLDEGVNIPSIRTAFIMASSTNPKEYIQRRGRVLRKFPGKRYATIFDFITLPIPLEDVGNYDENIVNNTKEIEGFSYEDELAQLIR